jgi:hypothetical protein
MRERLLALERVEVLCRAAEDKCIEDIGLNVAQVALEVVEFKKILIAEHASRLNQTPTSREEAFILGDGLRELHQFVRDLYAPKDMPATAGGNGQAYQLAGLDWQYVGNRMIYNDLEGASFDYASARSAASAGKNSEASQLLRWAYMKLVEAQMLVDSNSELKDRNPFLEFGVSKEALLKMIHDTPD